MFDFIKTNWLICLVIFLAVVAPSVLFGAVKFIFFFILAGIALIYLLSLFLGVKVTRMQRDMNQQMGGGAQQQSRQRKEGDVKIFTNEGTKKQVSKDVGDYVEFEEVKEQE